MNNNTLKPRLTLYDVIISLLIITTLAFYDIKLIFLGMQAVAILYSFLYIIRVQRVPIWVLGFFIWFALFCCYSLLSSFWAKSYNETVILSTLSFIQVGLIAICIIVFSRNEQKYETVIKAIILGAICLSIRFFIAIPVSSWGQMSRFSKDSIFGSNNPALVVSFAVVIIFYYAFIEKKYFKYKALSITLMVIFTLMSMLMGTRKGLLIILLGIGFIFMLKSKNIPSFLFRTMLLALSVYLVYQAIMKIDILYNSIGYRIEGAIDAIFGGEGDASTASRLQYIKDALRVFKENVLLGVGQDGYRYENSYSLTYSHNNYTEVLANLGIIGFLLYYSLFLILLIQTIKKRDVASISFVSILLIMDLFNVSFSGELTYIILAVCFLLVFNRERLCDEKSYQCS